MITRMLQENRLVLKQAYRRNMILGFSISAAVHLSIVGTALLVMAFTSRSPEARAVENRLPVPLPLPPPLRIIERPVNVDTHPGTVPPPTVGLIEAVPDSLAPLNVEIPSQDMLAMMAPESPNVDFENLGAGVDEEKVLNNLLPPLGTFIPCEELPVQIRQVDPEYPPLAARAGIEGWVWINVLIDREGKVRNVTVEKSSGKNAGFEEAAIDAAYKTVWKPAIANGQPTAIWVTYKVVFKLE